MTGQHTQPTRRYAPTSQWTLTPCCAAILLIPQRAGAWARMGRSPNFTVPAMNRPASTQVRRCKPSPREGTAHWLDPGARCLCLRAARACERKLESRTDAVSTAARAMHRRTC